VEAMWRSSQLASIRTITDLLEKTVNQKS